MKTINRRSFVKTAALTLGSLGLAALPGRAAEEAPAKRKFTICLSCGSIGVAGDPRKEIEWAARYGFEALEPSSQFLSKLSDAELQTYRDEMKAKNLAWGACGLPVQFRSDDAAFEKDLKTLPDFARALERAGVKRVATWLSPSSRSLTYVAHFRMHAMRLRQVAQVLGDHGLRLGLEYVGPKTAWSSSRFPFIHTMAEMKDLITEIGRDNVGFLLDSWHWYTAQETPADLLTLKASDVVLCHLNDAPANVPVGQQVDNRRDLPCATGVIDVKGYLGSLIKIGYDGPLVCEPFSQELPKMPVEQALATVAAAMKKAVQLAENPA
jgi:sugar phosphate isomerase/epimerase